MKHKLDMIAAWAKENGIRGYEHYDPNYRPEDRKRNNSFQKKRLNKSVTFKRRERYYIIV